SAVIEIEKERVGGDIEHVDVGNMDALHYAAPAAVALETEPHVGSQKLAIAHRDVAHAARHLAPHDKAAMPVKHLAVVHDQVDRRATTAASILILARLDADSIVTHIEY